MKYIITLIIVLCFFVGCASLSGRTGMEAIKRCPERICAGDIWPGDDTNCTCKN